MKGKVSQSGKLSIALGYPSAGWVLMAIMVTTRNQHLVVHCSDVFEPFSSLTKWLHQVADGNLPAVFEIDEEGRYKRFIVVQVGSTDKKVEFRVDDPLINEGEGEDDSAIFIRCLLNRKQMLKEFAESLQEWLDHKYDPLKFGYNSREEFEEGYGFDLHESIDIERLFTKINAL